MRTLIIIIFFGSLFGFKSNAALSEAVCASSIMTQLKIQNPAITGQVETNLLPYWTAICKGVLDHIKTAGVVSTVVTGVTGGGPPGGPLPIVAQPGTGTIQ